MLINSILSLSESAVIPLVSRTVVENDGAVETCTRYEVAPLETFHFNVGFVNTSIAPSGGDANNGAAGAASMVVKRQGLDSMLKQLAFDAYTRQ